MNHYSDSPETSRLFLKFICEQNNISVVDKGIFDVTMATWFWQVVFANLGFLWIQTVFKLVFRTKLACVAGPGGMGRGRRIGERGEGRGVLVWMCFIGMTFMITGIAKACNSNKKLINFTITFTNRYYTSSHYISHKYIREINYHIYM